MTDKIKKIYFTYEIDGSGNQTIKDVVTLTDKGIVKEEFDAEKHLTLLGKFCHDNGITGPDPISQAEEKGLIGRFDAKEMTDEKAAEFLGTHTNIEEPEKGTEASDGFDDDEEYQELPEEDVKKDHKGLKVAGGIAAGVAIVLGAGALFHGCSQDEADKAKEDIDEDDLYKNMTEEQREFFEDTFNAIDEFNVKATKEGNFKLAEDKTDLHITVDEAIALRIMLNNYTADELYNIFGTLDFDTNNIMDSARSAYSKLSTYYMNAKEASGISQLINDGDAREFFERHELAVIEFNNNPTTELSDEVIKNLYYDYIHGGSTGKYAQIENDGVAWLTTATEFGFELANRNIEEFLRINGVSEEEIAKYGDAAAAVGMKLNEITTSDLLNGINEEIELDILDEIDNKSLCAAATAETKEKIDALKMKQEIATTIITANAKEKLIEGLKKIDANKLASEVISSETLTPELLDKISDHSKDANELVEEYNGRMNSIKSNSAKVVAVMQIVQEQFGRSTEIDLPDLINNRFRTLEKVKEDKENNKGTISREEFDSMSKEEQKDYIKENGEVVKNETTTTETKVEESELTPTEKEDANKQKAVLQEIETVKNQYITAGTNDAISYTDQKGAYDFTNDDVTNPYNNEQIDLDSKSLFNGVAHGVAFGNDAVKSEVNAINSGNKQVQTSMDEYSKDEVAKLASLLSSDAKAYLESKYGSDWLQDFMDESYEYGFEKQVDGSLSKARSYGDELRKSAEEAYNKFKANESTEQSPKVEIETVEPEKLQPVLEPEVNVTDPNLNPNHSMPDEIKIEEKKTTEENKPKLETVEPKVESTEQSTEVEIEAVEPEKIQPVLEPENNIVDPNLNPEYSQPDEQPYQGTYYFSPEALENAYIGTIENSDVVKTK